MSKPIDDTQSSGILREEVRPRENVLSSKKYHVFLSNRKKIPIHLHSYNPPLEIGKINCYLLQDLIHLMNENSSITVIDFRPVKSTETAGFSFIHRKFADVVALFDPLEFDRIVSLFGDFKKNTLSSLIRLKNVLAYFNEELPFNLKDSETAETIVISRLHNLADGLVVRSNEKVESDLNLFIIDDDIGIIDLDKILKMAFESYPSLFNGAVNIHIQRGEPLPGSIFDLPLTDPEDITGALFQLSSLKWKLDKDFVYREIIHASGLDDDIFKLSFYPEQFEKWPSEYPYDQLIFDKIKTGENNSPLGRIESLEDLLEKFNKI